VGWVVYVRPVKVPAAADNFFGNSYNKYKAIEICWQLIIHLRLWVPVNVMR